MVSAHQIIAGCRPAFLSACLCLTLAAQQVIFCADSARASETRTDLEKIFSDEEFSSHAETQRRIEIYLKSHPNNADILGLKGRYLTTNGRAREAEPIFRKALAIAPANYRILGGMSFCQIELKNYAAAYEYASKANALKLLDPINVLPDNNMIENMVRLAHLLHRKGDVPALEKQLQQGKLGLAARNFREQGVLDQSLAVLDKLLKEDNKLAYAHLLRGVVYNNKSEHQKAIKDFDAVIALQPTMTTAYYLRGDSYFELGNKAKALESWKQSLNVQPAGYPGLIAFAYTAMTGRFREHFEPKDEQVLNRADVYYLCGVAESDLRHYAEAAKDYGECIAADPGEYKAYFSRAVMNERLNHPDLVMSDLNQAIKLNNRYIDALFERAKLNEKKHENVLAMADYNRVIAFNPGDLGALILRAELAVRLKNYEQALADYTKAINLSPTEDDPLMGRAKVYTLQGRYDNALTDYKKAMKLNPQDKGVVLDAIAHVEKLKKGGAVSVR